MATKEIDKDLLKKIQKIDLRGITFSDVNNKIVPIVSGATLLKWLADRLKILLYIAKLLSENKPKWVKDIVFYLEKSTSKQIDTLKIINTECEREPLIKDIISDDVFPYIIPELEKEINDDPYIIKNDDWTVRNLVYEFIEKVSGTTKFSFSSKQPRLIGTNMTAMKKCMKENDINLEKLEWYFDKVYSKFIYDWYTHKSIRWFLLDAEDYYVNTDITQKLIKWLMIYLNLKWEATNALAIWVAYKKHKWSVQSILENIWWDIENFELILKDFSKKSKSNGLNWTVQTVFNNLFNNYWKYVKTVLEEAKQDDLSEEFSKFIEWKWIKDDELINELLIIYKKDWIKGIESLI